MSFSNANLPDIPNGLLAGFFGVRFKPVLWVLAAIGIFCTLSFGFKDCGYYQGYEVGSILRPERYEATTWAASLYGDMATSAADAMNAQMGEIRGKNMPGFLLGIAIVIGTGALTYAVGAGVCRNALLLGEGLEHHDKARAIMVRFYRNDRGSYSDSGLIESSFHLNLATYTILFMCQPFADEGFEGTPFDKDSVLELRHDLRDTWGKLYLAFEGYRLTSRGHAVPLVDLLPTPLFTCPKAILDDVLGKQDGATGAGTGTGADTGSGTSASTAPAGSAVIPATSSAAPSPSTSASGATAETRSCSNCHATFAATAKFCPKCGTPITKPADEPKASEPEPDEPVVLRCPTCGVEVDDDDLFCGGCGTKLKG